jgi:asparagine synthase (glutamine-hydrolysing)
MCGIAGYVSQTKVSTDPIARMLEVINHRGPDEDGIWTDGCVAVGMKRLSIIDVTDGHQPLFDEKREIIVVFNGEIYNFQALQEELEKKGHKLNSKSDGEVIPHLFEEHGPNFVSKLEGMFAIAIWDSVNRRIYLYRDRLGKKPLYYSIESQDLAFASEIKAILQFNPNLKRNIDFTAISDYLSLQYIPSPKTPFKNVKKLPPAHFLTWDGTHAVITKYWDVDYSKKIDLPVAELVEIAKDKILNATKKRLISERPIGAFLSGGVDSSVVVAAMAKQSAKPINTFSIGFEEKSYDETRWAEKVAKHYGTNHITEILKPNVQDLVQEIAWFHDEPFADSSAIPSFVVSRLAKQHVTVTLNGDGGDESFGGYSRYLYFQNMQKFMGPTKVLGPIFTSTAALLPARGSLRRKLDFLSRSLSNDPCNQYRGMMTMISDAEKKEIISEYMASEVSGTTEALFRSWWDDSKGVGIDRLLDIDLHSYLPGALLPKVDISTMAYSLEARSPLLDHDVVEFAASLPVKMKVDRNETKVLLKRVARDWLPHEIVDRKKMGFGIPRDSWLRNELRTFAEDLIFSEQSQKRNWINLKNFESFWNRHQSGEDLSRVIWPVLMLELWAQTWLDSN